MASATASNVIRGQSLKSHFMPTWELAQLIQSFDIFSKKICLLFKSAIPWPEWGQLDAFVEDFLNFESSLKKLKHECVTYRGGERLSVKDNYNNEKKMMKVTGFWGFPHLYQPKNIDSRKRVFS